MNETTMNLINAIKTGDVVGMEDAFNSAMAERVSAQMDTMRINVAQTMFKTLETESSTEE
jgi:phage head maturation protease